MAAFNANRLACSASPVIVVTIPPMRSERAEWSPISPEAAATSRIALVASSAAATPSRAARRASCSRGLNVG
jgi:hypothetical protein